MDANDDIYVKRTHFNYFQMHTNFEQIYPKTAIVHYSRHDKGLQIQKGALKNQKSKLILKSGSMCGIRARG